MTLGPNHRDGCDGSNSYLSGEGYNRVRVCGCGAEDHAPEVESIGQLALFLSGPSPRDVRHMADALLGHRPRKNPRE
jgi:hypothetical protein